MTKKDIMKRGAALAASIVLAAAVGACGGGSDTSEAPPQQEAPARQGVFGRAPAASGGVPSVVTLQPAEGGPAAPPPEAALLDQLGLAFTPTQLIVRSGQTIEFANSESIAHNVHVQFVDNDSTAYIADMDPADRTSIVLDREGGYDVTCDVHPGMRAFIFVTSAPYAAFADVDGGFAIPDVPPGSYLVSVWSSSADLRAQRTVDVSGPSTEVDLTSPR